MGTGTNEDIAGIMELGYAKKHYASAANIITDYMKALPSIMAGCPFSLVAVNHLKPGKDANNNTIYTTPGGKSMKFAESYEMRMVRRGHPIGFGDVSGVDIDVTMVKNTLGESKYRVPLRFMWQVFRDKSQFSWWDWHYSSIEFLVRLEKTKGCKALWEEIMSIVDLREATFGQNGRVWSEKLGLPKEAKSTFQQASLALEARPDLLSQIYPLLGIMEEPALMPGLDYRLQLEQSFIAAEARAAARAAAPMEINGPLFGTGDDEDDDEGESYA